METQKQTPPSQYLSLTNIRIWFIYICTQTLWSHVTRFNRTRRNVRVVSSSRSPSMWNLCWSLSGITPNAASSTSCSDALFVLSSSIWPPAEKILFALRINSFAWLSRDLSTSEKSVKANREKNYQDDRMHEN